jgi:HSP20 family protein
MRRASFFDDFLNLRNRLDQLGAEAFDDPYRRRGGSGHRGDVVAQPMPLDVYATDEQVVILAAAAGMQPDELELMIHQDTVTLSGRVHDVLDSSEAKGATWYLQELGSGAYRRSVALPFPVDADGATATVENGLLRVVLPRAQRAKPRKISVSGSRSAAIEAGIEPGQASDQEERA